VRHLSSAHFACLSVTLVSFSMAIKRLVHAQKTWLEEQVRAFQAAGGHTASGRAIHVTAKAIGSG
jgi:hypothetical protein